MPMMEWPVADRDAWAVALRCPDFLDKGGRGARWRPASLVAVQGAYGRWLAWLAAQGVDLEAEAPAERFTVDRLRAYIAFLEAGRASVTVASYMGVLCMTVAALFPGRDWSQLQRAQVRLKKRSSPTRRKKERLVPADQLLQLGLDLIRKAAETLAQPFDPERDRTSRDAAARDFRDGVIVGLLASRPLRVKNLLEVQIGTHLRRSGGSATLQFAATETKTHRPHGMTWPEVLMPALTRYLAEIRPMLATATPRGHTARSSREPSASLWLAQGGTPLSAGGLTTALARHTRRRFGHALTPHLFRDCVATTASNEDPDRSRHAAQLLGHARLRTTERSYIAIDSTTAIAEYGGLITALRKKTRMSTRTSGRRIAT
jgi:site-specific recombinase XerD